MINPMELSGKHILVTGASSGIGKATCILASQLGAKVSMVARNEERLSEVRSLMDGSNHQAFLVDLANLEGIETVLKEIVAQQGRVDGAVHCAGIAPLYPISATKVRVMTEILEINYLAFLEIMRVLGKKKCSNDGASLIGISSVAAFRGARGQGSYAATKGAIDSLIKPMAKEYGIRKIRVNSVAFGSVNTRLTEGLMETGGKAEIESLQRDQYLGIIDTEDAANAICFLLSDASKFITGTVLHVDGGFLS